MGALVILYHAAKYAGNVKNCVRNVYTVPTPQQYAMLQSIDVFCTEDLWKYIRIFKGFFLQNHQLALGVPT